MVRLAKLVNSSDRLFSCDRCSKSFKMLKKYTKHLRNHRYGCEQCDRSFSTSSSLQSHVTKVHINKKPSLDCELCGKSYTTKHLKETHIRVHHLRESEHICPQPNCGKPCASAYLLREHIERHRPAEERRRHKCPHCCKVFSRVPYLKLHIDSVHLGQGFKCEVLECGKLFPTSSGLRVHLGNHLGEKPHQCHHCQAAFKLKSNLTRHINTKHLDQKVSRIHKCPKCSRAFLWKSDLARHAKTHLPEREREPFQCPLCPKTYHSRSRFLEHGKNGHSKSSLKEPRRPDRSDVGQPEWHKGKSVLECPLCHQLFAHRSKLDDHIRGVHTKEKPFQCPSCSFQTSWSIVLQRHKRNRHGTSWGSGVSCYFCGWTYYSKHSLICHLTTHTKERHFKS